MLKKVFSKQNRALLSELVRTDFKLRYQGSALGYTWSLLKPLFMFAILYMVFVKFLKIGSSIPHYPIYLLLGIVLWSFFAEMTNQSLTSIVIRGDLIRKIRIPRWIIIISTSVAALISLILNLIIVSVFMVLNDVSVTTSAIWFPVILLEIYIFAIGMSFFLSAAYVKYRDISHIWEVLMQAAFYVTPILYPLSLITNNDLQKLLLLNPMAQTIQDARNVLVTKDTITIAEAFGSSYARLIVFGLVIIFLLLGVLYFKREAKTFAEDL